jgi:hypothetical protein
MKHFLLAATITMVASFAPSAIAHADEFGDPTITKSIRLQQRLPKAIVDPHFDGSEPLITTVGESFFAPSPTVFGNQAHADSRVVRSFSGLGDYDVRLLGRTLIPPDTMGAVGTDQFVQLINGGFGVFSKKTGNLLGATSDVGFWSQLGQIGTGGDPRILFDHGSSRWIAIGFGANTKDINLAVSETSDALGAWRATRFEALTPIAPGLQTIADYPTLAMDNGAVYIGTNNFAQGVPGGPTPYRGTSLFVLNKGDIFNPAGPTLNGVVFNTPYVPGDPFNDTTRGYAIQGVNSNETMGNGQVVAASAFIYGALTYDIANAGTFAATQGPATLIDIGYGPNGAGRQPGRVGNPPLRNIDTLDDRVASNAWELNGKTYLVHTVTPDGTDYTRVRLIVMESATNNVIQTLDIGEGDFDFYQGALAVSDKRAVISYNRSGYDPATGRIGVFANTYRIRGDGTVEQLGTPIFIKDSLTPGYLNGNVEATGVPVGRQRWGDYAAVTLDPTNSSWFWLIGEFADMPYEVSRPGYPPASGYSRWGQWIAAVAVNGVPEPGTWATMIAGFGMVGFAMRRRRELGRAAA